MRLKLKTSILLAGTVLFTGLLHTNMAHAVVDDLVRQAITLLDKGQFQQAFDLLVPQETKRAGDPDFDTVMGIAANDTQQYTRAIFALERVLLTQPENSRARAELGRALFAVGDNAGARRVLLETKRDNIPAQVSATIDQFLQAIDRNEAEARSSAKFYVESSLGTDSNVNSGPSNGNVAVPAFGGAVFTLNPANAANKDTFATLGAGLSARHVLDPRWSLLANATINQRWHADKTAVDNFQLDGNLGTSYRYNKHELVAVVQASTYYVNAARARDQLGVVGEWTYRLNGEMQVTSYAQLSQLSYPGQSVRDANRTVLGTSYAQGFSSGLTAFGGIYIGTEKQKNSALPHLGHKLMGVRAGAQQRLNENVSAFSGISFENRKFGGTDPLFLVTRQDDQFNLNAGLNWVPAKTWRVTPQVSYTKVKSNIAISDFDRTVLSVSVRKDF